MCQLLMLPRRWRACCRDRRRCCCLRKPNQSSRGAVGAGETSNATVNATVAAPRGVIVAAATRHVVNAAHAVIVPKPVLTVTKSHHLHARTVTRSTSEPTHPIEAVSRVIVAEKRAQSNRRAR